MVGKGPASRLLRGRLPGVAAAWAPDYTLFNSSLSAALVLGFDWGKFLKDHSYKAAPVSCFKHVSALAGRGEGAGNPGARHPPHLTASQTRFQAGRSIGTRERTVGVKQGPGGQSPALLLVYLSVHFFAKVFPRTLTEGF